MATLLYFYICSENYVVKWSSKGTPKDLDMLYNLKTLFTVSMINIFI